MEMTQLRKSPFRCSMTNYGTVQTEIHEQGLSPHTHNDQSTIDFTFFQFTPNGEMCVIFQKPHSGAHTSTSK